MRYHWTGKLKHAPPLVAHALACHGITLEESMATAKKKEIPPKSLELYEKLVSTNPDIPRKGDTVPYTSLNGNMFSYLHASGAMALRLATGEREKFQIGRASCR